MRGGGGPPAGRPGAAVCGRRCRATLDCGTAECLPPWGCAEASGWSPRLLRNTFLVLSWQIPMDVPHILRSARVLLRKFCGLLQGPRVNPPGASPAPSQPLSPTFKSALFLPCQLRSGWVVTGPLSTHCGQCPLRVPLRARGVPRTAPGHPQRPPAEALPHVTSWQPPAGKPLKHSENGAPGPSGTLRLAGVGPLIDTDPRRDEAPCTGSASHPSPLGLEQAGPPGYLAPATPSCLSGVSL